MIRWLIAAAGSGLWSSIIFGLGMVLFFPSEWVKDQVAYQVQTQTNKKMLVHIGDAHSSGFMGVGLKDVSLLGCLFRASAEQRRRIIVNAML